jgi:Ca2+-binding RTX toxin-like protein
VRLAYLAAAALIGALIVPAAPAHAAPTCNGLPVTITGTAGNDTITGTAGADVISAGAGNDTVFGLDGNDTVCLGPGNDVLNGGGGEDTMVADAVPDGRDVLSGDVEDVTYAARTTPVNVTLDGVANDGAAGENDNIPPSVSRVLGGSAADVINSAAAPFQTFLEGGPGNDRLSGNFGLFGGVGDDILTFTGTGAGSLFGGDGNDTITGGPSTDNIGGGNGNDTLIGGGDQDSMFGGPGNDILIGQDGDDFMFGDDGNDRLIGGLGNDALIGGNGDDTADSLVARDGADSFNGGPGIDTANYGPRQAGANVVLRLSLDNVANDGEPGEGDNLFTDVENVNGGVGPNVITGSGSANVLRGGQSGDSINAVDEISGNDTVIGGFGFDFCTVDPGDVKNCEV